MKRRDFVTLLGGAAAAWPFGARAQQSGGMRRIGVLTDLPSDDSEAQVRNAAFLQGLQELGWTVGRNLQIDFRWGKGRGAGPLREYAVELVALAPGVILAVGVSSVTALQQAGGSVPMVFVQVSDPVGDGFVESLAHPGGNATGFTNTMSSLGGKWVELLKEAAPGVSQLGYLFNRAAAPGAGAYYLEPLLTAAAALGMKAVQLELRNADEIDSVIAGFAAAGGNGMVANSDSFITVNRNRIIAAANRLRLPTMYASAQNTNSGGLISYGPDTEQQWYAAASYVDRILHGAKPRDLPVQSPAKFILSINIKTAKAIGLDIPWFLQQRADEVIE